MASPISTQRSGLQRASTRVPQVGDYTGAVQVRVQEEADEKKAARERLAKELLDPAFAYMYMRVEGVGLVPVDKAAYAAIKRTLGR